MAQNTKRSKLRDFDPESLLDPAPSSSEEESDFSGADEGVDTGREHYIDFPKSKLRKKEVVPLGPRYSGSRISRDAAEDEDSDDPFARKYDEEDSEEEDEGDGMNGVALDGESAEDEPVDEEELGGGGREDGSDKEMESAEDELGSFDEDEDGGEGEDEEDEEQEDSDQERPADQTVKLREMMWDSKRLTSTLTQSAQADITKGEAVKKQRKQFDGLLNTRIKLQQAIISTNSMAADSYSSTTAPEASIEAAEAAALALLNNLTELRASLDSVRTGQKRKRTPYDSNTPPAEIWKSITGDEFVAMKYRQSTLEKWSTKTRNVSVKSSQGRLSAGAAQQTLTDVLASQVQNSSHLVARTQVPRSCAPLQAKANLSSSPSIYDDADFYGILLRELLEQRNTGLSANGTAEFVVQTPWQVAREAKTKKVVDTKASKGRRLRYTVHEKLQNFMAPEDRGTWGERQREELFSSLFGQKLGLGEADEVESEPEEIDAEEEGLMLFRN